MAPQGFTKRKNILETGLFSLPVPNGKNENKKRKTKELNPNAPVFKRRKEEPIITREPEIITIDDDNDAVKAIPEEVTIDDSSDNESIKIYEPDTETIVLHDSEPEDGKLIINIGQTENVDKIVASALEGHTSGFSNDFVEKGSSVSETNNSNRPHWTQARGYPKSWTKEMIRFYTEPCERSRSFDYEEILNNLNSKPSDWRINRADMIGPKKGRRSFDMCYKCDKFGHTTRECRKNVVCYICGEYNHRFPNCPNTLCLTCGKPASSNLMRCDSCDRSFKKKEPCGLCKQTTHEEFMCPSKWRKHLLIDGTNQTLQLNAKRYCYNCAQEGHFGFECPLTQNSPYPLENPLLTANTEHINDDRNHPDHSDSNVIFVSRETAGFLCSEIGSSFFKRFSNDTKCRVEFFQGVPSYVRIVGDENKVNVFKNELEKLKHETEDKSEAK